MHTHTHSHTDPGAPGLLQVPHPCVASPTCPAPSPRAIRASQSGNRSRPLTGPLGSFHYSRGAAASGGCGGSCQRGLRALGRLPPPPPAAWLSWGGAEAFLQLDEGTGGHGHPQAGLPPGGPGRLGGPAQSRLAAAQITHVSDLSKRRAPGDTPADRSLTASPGACLELGTRGRSCPGSLQGHSPTSLDTHLGHGSGGWLGVCWVQGGAPECGAAGLGLQPPGRREGGGGP